MQDRYWLFQDLLQRLKASLYECPELLVDLQSTYPKLVRESVALLEASDLLGFIRVRPSAVPATRSIAFYRAGTTEAELSGQSRFSLA